jgi:predicted branched-subunit amino acid permease
MASISVGIGAWGLITGVAMTKAGLTLPVALLMSLLVFAGSAQLAVLPLLATGAPLWVIWATAACVNLRFLILGPVAALLRRPAAGQRLRMAYFAADLNYVTFMRRFPQTRGRSPTRCRTSGAGWRSTGVSWQAMSIAGILLGASACPSIGGFGFAGTLVLLGLTCSMLTDRVDLAGGRGGRRRRSGGPMRCRSSSTSCWPSWRPWSSACCWTTHAGPARAGSDRRRGPHMTTWPSRCWRLPGWPPSRC